jgi:hypothetical protein
MGYFDDELKRLLEVPPELRKELIRPIRSITDMTLRKEPLELPLVEEYTKPDGTKAKRFKGHPYVPTFLPWFDVSPAIRYDPAKAFLLGIDLAEDHDRLNI